jgi:hypothetical protein
MAKTIKPADLGDAVQRELTTYHKELTRRINNLTKESAAAIVKKTKATAPKRTGNFRKNIASKLVRSGINGDVYAWYVKAPDYRLTHLLVHGHATTNGGHTNGDPFLENALNEVLPGYEQAVKEAVQND